MRPTSGVDCHMHLGNRDEAAAYIGDIDVVEARTWSQAFEIAGYECARIGHDWQAHRRYEVWVNWEDERWVWEPWNPATAFTACVTDLVHQGPVPEDPAPLTVRYAIAEVDLDRRRSVAAVEITNQDGALVAVASHILQWVPNDGS